MMRRWWHYLMIGVVAWIVFMLWRFPAPVAYDMFAAPLAGRVQVAGLAGTLWHGEAQQLQYQKRLLGRFSWQLSPWGLLLGRLGGEFNLTQDKAYLQGEGRVPLGGGELFLPQLEGRLPLSVIQPYLTMIPLPLEGVLSLKLEGVRVSSEGRLQRAEGRVVWNQAGVSAPQQLLFGDLQLTLKNQESGGIQGEIRDSGGPLQLQASFTLGDDGAYQLAGQVKAVASAPPALGQSLALLGKADSQGNYPLKFSGRL
jgi:general secretion pathway protein N